MLDVQGRYLRPRSSRSPFTAALGKLTGRPNATVSAANTTGMHRLRLSASGIQAIRCVTYTDSMGPVQHSSADPSCIAKLRTELRRAGTNETHACQRRAYCVVFRTAAYAAEAADAVRAALAAELGAALAGLITTVPATHSARLT